MKKEQKEQELPKEIKKIYLDSNFFIYAAIDEGEIGKKAKNIINNIREGMYKAYTSVLTIDEFLWRVQKEVGKELASEGANVFLTLSNLELLKIDINIIT